MVTSQQCLKKYGNPELLSTQQKFFSLWLVPEDIQKAFAHVHFTAAGTLGFPKKIFCNKDIQGSLEQGLRNVIARGLTKEIKFWDGCFIIRLKRGLKTMSLHSWAIAFDINLSENPLGKKPKLSRQLVQCFIDAKFDWGGDWELPRTDGMHFQLSSI